MGVQDGTAGTRLANAAGGPRASITDGAHSRTVRFDSVVALFKEQAKDKLPKAPLFAQADGKAWDRNAWKGPIKEAARAAGLPPATVAYTLRHSIITDLVTSGLDLMTVAQVSGTSVAMIEKHYAHLQRNRARDALAALAL